MEIKRLLDFYYLMNENRALRKEIVLWFFSNNNVKSDHIEKLNENLNDLQSIPQKKGQYVLTLYEDKDIFVELDYEINELKKDLFFLKNGEDAFMDYLYELHPGMDKEVKDGVDFLQDIKFHNLVTDRDGTVNNYCGRYKSSIQSIYNSIFMTRYAKHAVANPIILTSAPLDNIGLVDISVNPDGVFIYAGSKGREYFNKEGNRNMFPIKPAKQEILDKLNNRLVELTRDPRYEMFGLIGSGLQFKFGQTTIARQDISKSIPEELSLSFLSLIKDIVNEFDPNDDHLRIEDTGKDIEIILTIESGTGKQKPKDFDKGDGVNFLDDNLHLNISNSNNLICGDTKSDVPMAAKTYEKTKSTWSIFVTKEDELRTLVKNACPNSFFVSEPDSLVSIMNELGKINNT